MAVHFQHDLTRGALHYENPRGGKRGGGTRRIIGV